MGLELYPGRLKNQADSIIGNLREDNQALMGVLAGISQFTGNEELKSAAWSSMKGQLGNHQAVIQGLICGNEAVIQGNETLKGAVGNEDLIEDELNDKIENLQSANQQMQNTINRLENCMRNPSLAEYSSSFYSIISRYYGCMGDNDILIRDLQDKIEKLYRIEAETSSLFSGADSLYGAVSDGIAAIGKGWNGAAGRFELSKSDMGWKEMIENAWPGYLADMEEREGIEVSDDIIKKLLGMGDDALESLDLLNWFQDNEQSIFLLRNGVHFKINKIGNKFYLQMTGDIIESSMPNKWEYLGDFLKAKIKNVDWKKLDIKKLTRNGLKLDSDYLKELNYIDLKKYLAAFQESGGNKLNLAGKTFSDAFKKDIKFWDDFVEGDKLGAAGTALTVISNAYDNFFEDGEFRPSWDGVQDTITDSAVDISWGATSAAAGAAIGSFFVPPLGTAVGAIAGVVIGAAGDSVGIADVNNDGKKDSLVDMAKIGLDSACDFIGDFVGGFF